MRDEHGVAGEREKTVDGHPRPRRAVQLAVREAGQRGDNRPERHAGIDERLELGLELEAADAHGADLADLRAPRP